MNTNFYDAVKNRRTIYGLSKEAVTDDKKILDVVQDAIKFSPSAFNSQSGRVVVLLRQQHNRLWDITKEVLRKVVPKENFAETEVRINSFQNGYGTILFFEDQSVIEYLQTNYALYKDNFPIWSQQASGMLQYVIWTALETEGFGVNLQHYNPLIDDIVKKEWDISSSWKLIAEMPFGKPIAPPQEKDFKPLDERIKVFK